MIKIIFHFSPFIMQIVVNHRLVVTPGDPLWKQYNYAWLKNNPDFECEQKNNIFSPNIKRMIFFSFANTINFQDRINVLKLYWKTKTVKPWDITTRWNACWVEANEDRQDRRSRGSREEGNTAQDSERLGGVLSLCRGWEGGRGHLSTVQFAICDAYYCQGP